MIAKFLKWMLSFLEKSESAAPPAPKEDDFLLSLYQPQERLIFKYFNGKEVVSADPMVLFKRYAAVQGDFNHQIRAIAAGWKPSTGDDSLALHTKVTDTMRQILDLPPFADGGLSDAEVGNCFAQFIQYSQVVKKNSSLFPTPPKDLSTYTKLFSADSPPTKDSSASGRTETEVSTASPAPLSTASA